MDFRIRGGDERRLQVTFMPRDAVCNQRSVSYVEGSEVVLLVNQERIEKSSDSILKESVFLSRQFEATRANEIDVQVNRDILESETDLWQMGQTAEKVFHHMTMSAVQPSALTCFHGPYKFISLSFAMNSDKQVTRRTAYSLTDYFGEIGGLIALLFFTVRGLLLPLGRARVAAVLASRLFHFSDDTWS